MGVNEILTAITTVGFPIVVCLICFWYINQTEQRHRDEMSQSELRHKEEVNSLADAVNNNTLVMQKFLATFIRH